MGRGLSMIRRAFASLFAIGMVFAVLPSTVKACSVCFGDPESSMAKGAVAGVATLFGVVAFMLCSIAGVALFWVQRGRRMMSGPCADSDPNERES